MVPLGISMSKQLNGATTQGKRESPRQVQTVSTQLTPRVLKAEKLRQPRNKAESCIDKQVGYQSG